MEENRPEDWAKRSVGKKEKSRKSNTAVKTVDESNDDDDDGVCPTVKGCTN